MFLPFFRYVYIPAFTLFLQGRTYAVHSMGYSQRYGFLAVYLCTDWGIFELSLVLHMIRTSMRQIFRVAGLYGLWMFNFRRNC